MKNGRCDHLYSLNLNSPGSYVTATGVSRMGGGGSETRCGRNCLIIAEDIEPQGVHECAQVIFMSQADFLQTYYLERWQ